MTITINTKPPDGYHTAPLPSEPTHAKPGTPEKVAVLRERAARGESLFHPPDSKEKA